MDGLGGEAVSRSMEAFMRVVGLVSVALCAVSLIACQPGRPPAPAPEVGSGVPVGVGAGLFGTVAAATAGAPAVTGPDPDVARGLSAIEVGCDVQVDRGVVTQCGDDELRTLVEGLNLRPSPQRIGTVTAALEAPGPRRAAAAVVLSELFGLDPEALLDLLAPTDVERLLAVLDGQDTPQAVQLAPLATLAAMRHGETTRLRAIVQNHPSPRVQDAAVRHWLVAGRLELFEEIRPLAVAPDDGRVLLGLAAVTQMHASRPLSDDERAVVCPWARPVAEHRNQQVAATAGRLLIGACEPSDVQDVIGMIRGRLDAGEYALPLSDLAVDLCRGQDLVVEAAAQRSACELLRRVAADRRVHPQLRDRARRISQAPSEPLVP